MTLNQARFLFSFLARVEADEVSYSWPPPPDSEQSRAAEVDAEGERAYQDALSSGASPEEYAWVHLWLREPVAAEAP